MAHPNTHPISIFTRSSLSQFLTLANGVPSQSPLASAMLNDRPFSIFRSRFLVTTSNVVIPLHSPHCNILIASDDTTATGKKMEKLGKGRRKDKINGKFVNLVDDDVRKGAWQILEFQKVRQRPLCALLTIFKTRGF